MYESARSKKKEMNKMKIFPVSVGASSYFVGVMLVFSVSLAWASGPSGPVPKTGQTTITGAGDDGDFQKGVPLPDPRFTDNGDGTVRDNLTNIVWMKNANCWGWMTWSAALAKVVDLNAVVNPATCSGYTGSHRDWRLPNIRELTSLEDLSQTNPILPLGHPFTGVQTDNYWSSTTYADSASNAWYVNLSNGSVGSFVESSVNDVWPVRGGQ